MSPEDPLELAKRHLERVQGAWDEPTDWTDLALYGFYCLEDAVVAAASHCGIAFGKNHPSKIKAALELTAKHNLPDVSDLLIQLNDARKAVAYGDTGLPELNAEATALAIEQYLDLVESLINA